MGHDVTLFASGDSQTSARLVPCCPSALRLGGLQHADAVANARMLRQVDQRQDEFDVVHVHLEEWARTTPHLLESAHITTVHGRIDTPDTLAVYAASPRLALVSISNEQRAPLRHANWLGTVYHGLNEELFTPSFESGSYLAFLGRISPEKRVDRAIAIAQRYGMPLKIAAKVDNNDYAYYLTVRDLLQRPGVEFMGEVNEQQKHALLRGAHALLFPIDWPEPFGLVMVESMACGTPVIAYRHGSVPEVVDHGVTGFVVSNMSEALAALDHVSQLSRQACAEVARKRFSAQRMARDYVQVYEKRLLARSWKGRVSGLDLEEGGLRAGTRQ